jgi:hypothetical protein
MKTSPFRIATKRWQFNEGREEDTDFSGFGKCPSTIEAQGRNDPYRPKKSALDAVGTCRKRRWRYDCVVDLDIKGFFDNIDHPRLGQLLQPVSPISLATNARMRHSPPLCLGHNE